MDEEIVLSYLRKAIKEKQISGNIYAAFTYGNPKGKDVDLCIVCDLPEKIPEPENKEIDLKKVTPFNFEAMLREHGKDAVELRVVPTSVFGAYSNKEFWFRPEDESKRYLENMLRYCKIENVRSSDMGVR